METTLSIDMVRRQIANAEKSYRKAMTARNYELATILATEYDDFKALEYRILNPTFAHLV